MRSRSMSRLALILCGTVAGLLIGEGLFRLLGLAPVLVPITLDEPYASFVSSPNPKLGYVPKAGVGDINSDGFRDRAYSRRKSPGTFRIAVIGDSVGFGFCTKSTALDLDETFAKVLERDLNGVSGAEASYEVLNYSVSGYNTLQEVEFLRWKALAYDPDLVLVAYSLNDTRADFSRELRLFRENPEWEAQRDVAESLYRSVVFKSHFARLVWHLAPGIADAAVQ